MPFDCVLAAWRAHEAELRGYLIHRLGDADSADDVLQEIFLKAMRQGATFCEINQPRAWLFQVARNTLLQRNLAEMPVEDRQIIEQCDLQGVRQQDFARAHGLSLPATKSRLLRARQRLRDRLTRNCQVHLDENGRVCCHVPRH